MSGFGGGFGAPSGPGPTGATGATGGTGPTGATGAAGSANISGTTGTLVKFTAATAGADSIITESAGQINIDGATKIFATAGGGWLDVHPVPQIPGSGGAIPNLTAWSAPHASFSSPEFVAGTDITWLSYHVPHGTNVASGVYLHAHFVVDSASTTPIVFEWIYAYAHGYARQVFSTPATVTVSLTPNGVAKTHYIAEIASPILAGTIEPDGVIKCRIRTTSGPNILVEVFDAHMQSLSHVTANKNFPFGGPT